MTKRFILSLLLGFVMVSITVGPVRAQGYPAKPVRLVVPFAPGGSTDYVGRLYAEQLGRRLGSAVVIVDNKPGAATNIGLDQVAHSDADGYTLLLATSQMIINMAFGPMPAVNPFEALAPVALIGDSPFMVASPANTGFSSLKDLLGKSRAQPLTISHAQFEPQIQFLTETTGASLNSIPYKGGAPSVTAALGGQVDLVGAYLPVLMAQVKAGKLHGLAVSSTTRISSLPGVPTFAEQGFPRFTTAMWVAVFAPKGTPEPILQRLSAASQASLKDAQFAKSLQASGFEPRYESAQDLTATMRKELKLWMELAKSK
jgi:tripartite-type tricarboxylate transporter receptor subunit TctC